MPYTSDELTFLLANPDAVAEASQRELTRASELRDVAELRSLYGERARCLAELVTARRRMASKIEGDGNAWMVDSASAQQATPWEVGRARARHLQRLGVQRAMDVTCSVGTELAIMRAAGLDVMGGDLDMQRLRMARHNVPGVPVMRADATCPPLPKDSDWVIIADPARRNSSGRIHRLSDVQPSLPALRDAHPGREMAIKCAPGIDFSEVSEWAGQIDVVSVDGNVKEACVYSRGLGFVARRAVLLRGGQEIVYTSAMPFEPDDEAAAGPVGQYVFDPDGAIVRAGLVRHVAQRHGWWQLDPRIAYLTGDSLPSEDVGVRAFRVDEQVPVKKLKAALQARGARSVEILVRGVDVDPDALRKKLKLGSGKSARSAVGAGGAPVGGVAGAQSNWSVVITRIGSTAYALICTAV